MLGVIIQKILPDWAIYIGFVGILGTTGVKTFQKGFKTYKKEQDKKAGKKQAAIDEKMGETGTQVQGNGIEDGSPIAAAAGTTSDTDKPKEGTPPKTATLTGESTATAEGREAESTL